MINPIFEKALISFIKHKYISERIQMEKKMNIREAIKTRRLYFDGGTGTELIKRGLKPGECSEGANFAHPDWVSDLHRAYINAGANIIKTNTFGVNSLKYENYEEYIARAIALAKEAATDRDDVYIALDIGPTGRMLSPLGDLAFEDAVEIFAKNIRAAKGLPVDLILIETMNDSYETKAALLAAKENCDLPVFVTNVYDSTARTVTGSTPEVMAAMLEALGADAIGANCSFGPKDMLGVAKRLAVATDLPIIINPNAGLPTVRNGETVFSECPEDFSEVMAEMAEIGAGILGGCCGTTPLHIEATVAMTKHIPVKDRGAEKHGKTASAHRCFVLGKEPILVGERINPTGKPKLKEALISGNNSYILSEAIKQEEYPIFALDVNCGLPGVDEIAKMKELVQEIQSVISLPIQIDSSNESAIEAALRIANGVPLVNSVNGSERSLSIILPLVKKYGGVCVALTMDESGIPADAEGRVAIAKRIADRAARLGIGPERLLFDPLCLSVSTDRSAYKTTLSAVKMLSEMGLYTTLGVSNISFGMPNREKINSAFFRMALADGLSAAIINPYSEYMMGAVSAYLSAKNEGSIDAFRGEAEKSLLLALSDAENISNSGAEALIKKSREVNEREMSLKYAIIKGLREDAAKVARALIDARSPMDIINGEIIPALDTVGEGYDKKEIYLPSLLMSAEAATSAFDALKPFIPRGKVVQGRILLATVKGDIHDIGKNIVRVVLESRGFEVRDLGRDVSVERVVAALSEGEYDLLGLSALMTTTLPAMEETVRAVKAAYPSIKIMVGGAVLNPEYAAKIGADFYGADAPSAAKIADSVFSSKLK